MAVYTAPPLSVQVVLAGSYTPPALSVQVVLGAEINIIAGTLSATLPPLDLPLIFAGIGERDRNWLWAALPAPVLSLAFRARERSITIALAVDLPPLDLPLALAAAGDYIHAAAALAALPPLAPPPLALSAAGTQDLALPDADGPRLATGSAQMLHSVTTLALAQQPMQPTVRPVLAWAQAAEPIRVGARLLQQHGLPLHRPLAERAAQGLPLGFGARAAHTDALRMRRPLAERAAQGLPIRQGAGIPATETLRTRNRLNAAAQQSLPLTLRLPVGQHQARVTASRLHLRWTDAADLAPGRWWPFYEVPSLLLPVVLTPSYTPRPLHCRIALSWIWIAQPYCAGFDPDPNPGIVIPVQEVYIVINSFSLVRVDTSQPVDALSFEASIDASSWVWSWSATIPASQLALVASPALGEFVELLATVNGTGLRLVVERYNRDRSFGQASVKVSGRGRAAWLADPHSPIQTVMNTETRTAQQLVNDALMVNGVSIGWAVDWQLEDWSVPAGAWSHTGTYIEAAIRIAESGGGYVQADRTAQTLHILPYYPVAPWLWDAETPDLTLPDAVCVTEGIEWLDKPPYNAIYIVGGEGGRQDLVKRAGTAGDRLAPTVVDPLATATAMTRQRGLRVIADTGRQALVSVSLPILAETGIILPGTLVHYTEQGVPHRGLSRSVAIQHAFPTARQTIRIETHELEPV